MKCMQVFCVWQNNGLCTYDNVHIDMNGSCPFYMPVNIPEDILIKYKQKHIKAYEKFCEKNKDNINCFNNALNRLIEKEACQ